MVRRDDLPRADEPDHGGLASAALRALVLHLPHRAQRHGGAARVVQLDEVVPPAVSVGAAGADLADQDHVDALPRAAAQARAVGVLGALQAGRAAAAGRPATVDVDRAEDVPLIDARAGERYRGENEPVDPKAGHIPGALSAPWTENLGADGRFKPAGELRDRFSGLGAEEGAVVYCGSGVNACHDLLAMELAGVPNGRLYAGSWSDWSQRDAPVAIGSEPR